MDNRTDITILLDRSGSMAAIKGAMESGLEEFLLEHKKTPSTHISLVQFDDKNDQDVVWNDIPIGNTRSIVIEPRGNTPLLDALCKCIDRTGERLRRMPPSSRPNKVLIIVITDGQENSSKEFKRLDVFSRVRRQEEQFNWEFVYLGANQDAFAEAASMGIKMGSTITYGYNTIDTVNVMRSVAANSSPMNVGANSTFTAFTQTQTVDALKEDEKLKGTKSAR